MIPVAVELPAEFDSPGEWLAGAQAVDAAGAHALLVQHDKPHPGREALLGALAAGTHRAGIDGRDASETVRLLARGRLIEPAAILEWHWVPVPDDREHWARLREEAEAAGAEVVVVPQSDRLLDLLRNPEPVEDRSDLNLAQG